MSNDIVQIAISPDSQEIATISYDNEVSVWSADQLQQKARFKIDTIGLKRIEYMSNERLVAAGETTTSWDVRTGKLDGPGIKADDYVFLTFVKDEGEIDLRARVTEGKSTVNIQGDGLQWTKPLPGGQKLISYETWLRVNLHPATLDLLDKYRAEMP